MDHIDATDTRADVRAYGAARRPRLDRTWRSTTLSAAALLTGLALAAAPAISASARPDKGAAERPIPARVVPVSVGRIGGQVVRCNDHEGELGGAGAKAPLTLPAITTCATPNAATPTATPVKPAWVRQLEHELLR
ncbi:hypothetical protein [Nostocoides sp. HKS02]|uniref:hypothetical protein n=1 Tax=Nostocoides sp. HKS02 TaxID=1813880 RepID=UPI0012B4BF44|nr:hypothetical protein [Tetrasphaera sp. HKS02]QGN58551.1 hypothetical protein GKE56_12385 [Tetrasphaera sp. HKS02]